MKSYRDEAIVLRTHKLGEADRIITLLTAEHGQVRAVAKGVRKTTSKFGARVEPFSVIDAQLHRGRTLDTLTQVASIAQYGDAIAADYDLYLAATVVVETAQRLTTDAHDGTHSQYLLLLGALNALARGRHDPTLIRTSYTLRALALAGWAPSCFDCAVCGTQGPHTSFSIPDGGAVCDTCRPPGASSPAPDVVGPRNGLVSDSGVQDLTLTAADGQVRATWTYDGEAAGFLYAVVDPGAQKVVQETKEPAVTVPALPGRTCLEVVVRFADGSSSDPVTACTDTP